MSPASAAPAAGAMVGRVLDRHAAAAAGRTHVGGKASGLLALAEAGLSVPPFACVTTAVYDDLMESMPPELRAALADLPEDRAALPALAERARAHVLETGLARADAEALAALVAETFTPGAPLAVRSSSVGEDSARSSFAGQFATFLGVAHEDVPARVLDCVASALSARALAYRHARGAGVEAMRMGVVIQHLVDGAVSGIAFTADPSSGRTDRTVVTAGLGLGEGVVAGSVETDAWTLDACGAIVERAIAGKRTRCERDPERPGATRLVDVDPAVGREPALADAAVAEIARQARAFADVQGAPQDVEWVADADGRLWIVQARPVTTVATGRRLVFDNANIVESYPGLTSPLTFSLMRRAYEVNFLGLVRAFGAPRSMVEPNRDVYANLVGLLDGRMYYDLTNWYRMFLQLPGMERALPAFEHAMGFEPEERPTRRLTGRERLRWLPLQALFVARVAQAWRRIPRDVQRFHDEFDAQRRQLDADDVTQLEAHELVDRLERISERLFDRMTVAPISDFLTQQIYGLVGRMIEAWDLGEAVLLRNELLCGERGMQSVEPVRSLVRIAERVRGDAAARLTVGGSQPATEVWERIEREAPLAWLRADLATHLHRYGDRSMNELKLEARTLQDDPSALITLLRNYVRGGQEVASMIAHEQRIRRAAEQHVRRRLRGRPLRRLMLGLALRRTRQGLKTRENVRLTRGRMAGMFRRLSRALGDRLVEHGALERREDVFMLTMREAADAVRGASVTGDLRALVALRREEYARAAARGTAPGRVTTHGIVQGLSLGDAPGPAPARADGGTARLSGTACSPGRVRARALVVDEPAPGMAVDGEILVAAATDPGWVFLMVAAGGLVSEKGNVLSHTAIIGRELGIPTLVGVEDAMRLVPDGALVELDGNAGTLTVEEEP